MVRRGRDVWQQSGGELMEGVGEEPGGWGGGDASEGAAKDLGAT